MPDVDQAPRYRRVKRLGAGGMATVTLAEDTVLGRPVALKRVHSGGNDREMLRLKREALVGASLNHPNLVFVYDAHLQDDGDVVIVMEYVDGETLADVLRARGALEVPEALRVLRGMATALDAIHERGIVHRDVKPANVLLGSDGTVKLADLGVADVADRTRITESGAVVGSFNYMSAEQIGGAEPSSAMDVYALAAVAYEMLSGKRARPEANPLALAHAISTQPPPDLRSVWPAAPPATAEVLRRAMSAHPDQRPRSAGELVRRLEASFAPEEPTGTVAVPHERERERQREPDRAGRRRPALLVPTLLALTAILVAGIAVAALGSGGGQPSGTSGKSAPARTAATSHRATAASGSTTSRSSGSATTTSGSPTTANSSPAVASSTPSTSGSSTPAGAVEQFYMAAANHQYAAAWALADSNLRSQLGGYGAFENEMSSVRSITFHRAQTVGAVSSAAATVAVSTTSVQTDRTQQCTGTAQTVRSAGTWLVDRVSIGCSS